jgi:ABC-type lipoprotein export system ATPase subunit
MNELISVAAAAELIRRGTALSIAGTAGALRTLPPNAFRAALARFGLVELNPPVKAPPTPAATPARPQALRTAQLPRGGRVEIHDVSKSYGSLQVLSEVSLTMPSGSVTAIIGPSGSGKSTLLRTINHLERVDRGFIAIDGELVGYRREGDTLYELREPEVLRRRTDVGMVFQHFNLFPHLTVLENITEAPVAVRGLPRTEAEALARDLLTRVGLADKAGAYPRQLSGGQQRRTDLRARSRTRGRSAGCDQGARALRHHADHRHPRDRLRPRDRRYRRLHGTGPGGGDRDARAGSDEPAAGADRGLPRQSALRRRGAQPVFPAGGAPPPIIAAPAPGGAPGRSLHPHISHRKDFR